MKRKKTIRNIIIAIIVAVVIVAAVALIITLRKDARGMNAFDRARTAATADGVSVTMQEYALMLDNTLQRYSSSVASFTDEQYREYQQEAAKDALLIKIYTKEAKALGLTLTDEEKQAAKDAAQGQIDAIVEQYTESLVKSGSYSKAALDKQVANYYTMLGMNQSSYYAYIKETQEANTYLTKLNAYYEENGSGLAEEEVLARYHETADQMKDNYQTGLYSQYLMYYLYGLSMPMLYVPEDFFYVDFIEVRKTTEEEVNELFDKVYNGEMTFDELMASDDNVDYYRNSLEGPYAVGDGDYGYLFDEHEEAYLAAKALEVGQFGHSVEPVTSKDDDGNETVTGYIGYMFRRAEGKMCEDGQTGYVDIDYYTGVRESIEGEVRQDQWMSDAVFSDAIYDYKGTL